MSAMTPLDRLRAAFPEPWDVVAHRTEHITAPTNRGYARAVLFGDLVTVIGRGDTVSAAVDACIAARDAMLRPWIERAFFAGWDARQAAQFKTYTAEFRDHIAERRESDCRAACDSILRGEE